MSSATYPNEEIQPLRPRNVRSKWQSGAWHETDVLKNAFTTHEVEVEAEGGLNSVVPVSTLVGHNDTATAIIVQRPYLHAHALGEAWATEILGVSSEQPGFLGGTLFKATQPGEPFITVITYSSYQLLKTWVDSPQRMDLIEKAKHLWESVHTQIQLGKGSIVNLPPGTHKGPPSSTTAATVTLEMATPTPLSLPSSEPAAPPSSLSRPSSESAPPQTLPPALPPPPHKFVTFLGVFFYVVVCNLLIMHVLDPSLLHLVKRHLTPELTLLLNALIVIPFIVFIGLPAWHKWMGKNLPKAGAAIGSCWRWVRQRGNTAPAELQAGITV
eukprot:CAMPEP_0177633714 /NCGR_PEP_ID=MMETSP0447-20121125/2985_1 /TAXON_ID=0 /ORGANISM="Stygamoeba regulata, Strain BSH-02190019" /LENGTH=326 /DNA_ID=CAMNT_0019135393 /DNA_START=9 /DNA_END=989 /DNA_ORIENTATION=-